MNLVGKVAIVTGSSRGIGRVVALRLAKEGANVVVNYRANFRAAKKVAEEIRAMGRESLVIRADVAHSNEVNEMVRATLERLGKIDILVNNAGIEFVGPFIDFKEEDWNAMFDVNVKGVFLCSKAVAKHMVKQGGGKIINIASISGKTGAGLYGAYCASKFAVVGLTQSMALELAPYKINVNAICPGVVETDMLEKEFKDLSKYLGKSPTEIKEKYISQIPMGQVEKPQDVANLAVFLASSNSDYMTGQAINICGGVEMH